MNRQKTVREQADRLLALLRHAARFWVTGFSLMAVGCLIAVGAAMTHPRTYRSEALILYREPISSTALGREEASEPARRIGLRLRELVLSRSRLEKIIEELKLYPEVQEDRGIAEAVDLMRNKVNFKSREGDTYSLSFEGEDPVVVQKAAQRLTEALMSENQRSAVEQAAGTKEFLDTEAQRIEEELQRRTERLAKFLQEHPAYAAAQQQGGTGMAALDPRKAAAGNGNTPVHHRSSDPHIAALEREAERIQARLSPTPPPSPSLPPEAKEVKDEWNRRKADATRELEAAERDLQDKKQRYTDKHPDVLAAQRRVEGATRGLEEVQIGAVKQMAQLQGKPVPVLQPLTPEERSQLEADLGRIQTEIGRARAASHRAESSNRESAAQSTAVSEADGIVKLETTFVQLNREVAEAKEQRQQVEAKRFTAEIKERLTQNERGERMVVIDPPNRPTRPVRGGRTQLAGIGGALALFVAMLTMLVLALLDDRVYDRHDIERLDIAPLLCAVPPPGRGITPAGRRDGPRHQEKEQKVRKGSHG